MAEPLLRWFVGGFFTGFESVVDEHVLLEHEVRVVVVSYVGS